MHAGEFVVALDVSGGGESLVRIASPIERDWLEPTREDVIHELVGDRVRATRRLWYDELLLREIHTAADPDEAGEERSDGALSSCPMFVRRIATVTISAPDATTASRVSAKSRYLPVPTRSRER